MAMKVFVYGTLMTGQGNAALLTEATKISNGVTGKRFRMYTNGAYPMLKADRKGYPIRGEIWDADPYTLKALDRLEGVPEMYLRDCCVAFDQAGVKHLCFLYVYARPIDRLQEIETGDWLEYESRPIDFGECLNG
jgi:gamma-glutamylcyclotransferase (GGCT)/AIG2-like uncharacterized protein YtfP